MYVVIGGKTEVSPATEPGGGGSTSSSAATSLGEVGLVRHGERTADVVASGEVDVLALDERFLRRIQNRYPRIASQVFLNLTRLLSDHLQRTAERYVAAGNA
jgi:CRP-like cAMP-binding protein